MVIEELEYQCAEFGVSSEGRREGLSEGGGRRHARQSGFWPWAGWSWQGRAGSSELPSKGPSKREEQEAGGRRGRMEEAVSEEWTRSVTCAMLGKWEKPVLLSTGHENFSPKATELAFKKVPILRPGSHFPPLLFSLSAQVHKSELAITPFMGMGPPLPRHWLSPRLPPTSR